MSVVVKGPLDNISGYMADICEESVKFSLIGSYSLQLFPDKYAYLCCLQLPTSDSSKTFKTLSFYPLLFQATLHASVSLLLSGIRVVSFLRINPNLPFEFLTDMFSI